MNTKCKAGHSDCDGRFVCCDDPFSTEEMDRLFPEWSRYYPTLYNYIFMCVKHGKQDLLNKIDSILDGREIEYAASKEIKALRN